MWIEKRGGRIEFRIVRGIVGKFLIDFVFYLLVLFFCWEIYLIL